MEENKSTIQAVLSGNWAHLMDVCNEMKIKSITARIDEKKAQILASINNTLTESEAKGTLCGKPNAKVTDGGEHFPIGDADQARNALARVAQKATHAWWNGTKEELMNAVKKAVKAKFPSIDKDEE